MIVSKPYTKCNHIDPKITIAEPIFSTMFAPFLIMLLKRKEKGDGYAAFKSDLPQINDAQTMMQTAKVLISVPSTLFSIMAFISR